MVEAGETDVKAQPKLSEELVIEAVEFLRDVIAQQGREEAGDVSLFGQKKVETFSGPGNVAACGLSSQSDLRGVTAEGEGLNFKNVSMFSKEKHTVTCQKAALTLKKLGEVPLHPHGLAWRGSSND